MDTFTLKTQETHQQAPEVKTVVTVMHALFLVIVIVIIVLLLLCMHLNFSDHLVNLF